MPRRRKPWRVAVCRARALGSILVLASSLFPVTSSHALSRGFLENRGQEDPAVRFYRPGAPADYYFTAQGIVVDLRQLRKGPRAGEEPGVEGTCCMPGQPAPGDTLVGCAVYIRFEGANANPVIEAEELLPTEYNYFMGKDESRWVRGVRAARRVVYRDLWPGQDLVFTDEGSGLAYELRDAGGGDPGTPRFSFEGQERVVGLPGEARRIVTGAGSIDQMPDGVSGSRGLIAMATAGGAGDAPGPGSVDGESDPGSLAWSTFLGGWTGDVCYGVAHGVQGSVTVAGYTWSNDFPVTPGAYSVVFNHGFPGGPVTDGFVGRLSPTGSSLLWCTYIGGNNDDRLFALALNAQGNAVVTGVTYSDDFPTTEGALEPVVTHAAAFVSEIAADGSALLASTYLGGVEGWASANSIALDVSGNIVVKGYTVDAGFPTTPGAFDRTFHGGGYIGSDAFVSKLLPNCTGLVWSTFLGGSEDEGLEGDEVDRGLAVAGDGGVITSGVTGSPDFPITPGALHTVFNGIYDSFVTRISADGSTLEWSTYLGGSTGASSYGLALDAVGNVVLTGKTSGDAFVTKLESTGLGVVWNTFLGGSDSDAGRGVSIDAAGNVVVVGWTLSTDFPTTPGAFQSSAQGSEDGFVAMLPSWGGSPLWTTYLGGNHDDVAAGVAFDGAGNPIVVGSTTSEDFPVTPGAFDVTGNGGGEATITKFNGVRPATSVGEGSLPDATAAISVSPDPFRHSADVRFTLRRAGPVSLAIYDVRGRRVVTLVEGAEGAGEHRVSWDGRDDRGASVASGLYFLRYNVDGQYGSERLIRLR